MGPALTQLIYLVCRVSFFSIHYQDSLLLGRFDSILDCTRLAKAESFDLKKNNIIVINNKIE